MAALQDLPDEMTALVLDIGASPYESGKGFEKRQVPAPFLDEAGNPDDADCVIIRTLFAGICGSDKGLWFRNAFGDLITKTLAKEKKSWRVPGHELLGEVVAVGSTVRERYHYRPGNIVSTESHVFCGQCYQCRHGEEHICKDTEIIGFSRDGCFSEFIKLPAKILWPTDLAKIRPEVGAIQEPLGNGVHVCSQVDLKGKNVLISGAGSIGLFAIVIARHMGARKIIVVDPDAKHRDFAARLGADETLAVNIEKRKGAFAAQEEIVTKVFELTGGIGVDVGMEMAGFNASLNNVIKSTRRGGDIILFGIKAGDFVVQNYENIVLAGKTLHSVIGRRIFDTWKLTKQLLEELPEIQDTIFDVVLNGGKGTVIPINEFSQERLEAAFDQHNKVVLKF